MQLSQFKTAAGWEQKIAGKPAELRVPLHGVDVEEHGAASVGDVRAVHSSVAAPCQALREVHISGSEAQTTGAGKLATVKAGVAAGLRVALSPR